MTTTITVTSHNYPALVRTFDDVYEARDGVLKKVDSRVSEVVLKPEDGELTIYRTTSRSILIKDIEFEDPRAAKKDK